MHKFLYVCGCTMLAVSLNALADNRPTDINYCTKGKSWSGKEYSTYTVRCSDGTKREISAWEGRKKWCIGRSQSSCTSDQLKTAKRACAS